jgi:hypothetical protein
MAPGDAAPSPHTHTATCAHADGAAIERPVTNFASALGDLAAYQQGPRELWRLTPAQLSNIVTAAMQDQAASLALFTDTLKLQSGADNYGNPTTNIHQPILEYVLTRQWRESPYPSVRYNAVSTLMLDYVNTLGIGDAVQKYKVLDGEIDLADTLAEDIARGIDVSDIQRIEQRRLYAAAIRGDEEAYCRQVDRIMAKWKDADARAKAEMLDVRHGALNYVGVPAKFRDKYLPIFLRSMSEADIRRMKKDSNLWRVIQKQKKEYGIK